jgi:hypothetical protein
MDTSPIIVPKNLIEEDAIGLVEWLQDEVRRLYMEELGKALLGPDYTISQEEVDETYEKIDRERKFDTMMFNFICHVDSVRPPSTWNIYMSTPSLQYIRWFHQKYQKEDIYRGKKRNGPALFGVPIVIDESLERPRLGDDIPREGR